MWYNTGYYKYYNSVITFNQYLYKTIFIFQAFMKQSDTFSGRPTVKTVEQFINGKGITLRDGPFWKVQREFGITAFNGYSK